MGRLLRFDELSALKGVPFSRSHLRRLEKRGEFPKRIPVGGNSIVWDEDEIDTFLNTKRAARNAPPPEPVGHRRVRRRGADASADRQ